MLAAWPVLLGFMSWNCIGAPWQLLLENCLIRVWAGATVLLAGLWWMQAGAHAGLTFHLLGLTAMVLMFGWRLAMISGFIALGLLAGAGVYDWTAAGVNGLIGVVLPVLLADRLHGLIYQWLPKHFFIYLMVAAHFSSMLVIAAVIVSGGLVLLLLDAQSWARVGNDYLLFLPMIMLPEGFLNGAVLTMLTLLRPTWVRSFDDRDYIDGQ
jgi:uncharacterized membrane protein